MKMALDVTICFCCENEKRLVEKKYGNNGRCISGVFKSKVVVDRDVRWTEEEVFYIEQLDEEATMENVVTGGRRET